MILNHSQHCSQHVTFPTHDKNHILDLVITFSDPSLAPSLSSTHCSPSDHFPVLTKLSINPTPLSPPTIHSFRRLHSIDTDSFLTDLKSSRLITHHYKSLGSLLISYNYTTLSCLLDKHAPVTIKLFRRQTQSNHWFTSTLRAFRSSVRHVENLWKRTHSALDWSSFNQYHNLILAYKEHPYSNLVSSSSYNPKRLWQTANSYTVNPLRPYLRLLQISSSPTSFDVRRSKALSFFDTQCTSGFVDDVMF